MSGSTGSEDVRRVLPIADARTSARVLGAGLRERPRLLVGTAVLLLVEGMAWLVAPFVLGRLVDDVVDGAAVGDVVPWVWWLVGAAIAVAVLSGTTTYAIGVLGESALASLRERVVARSLRLRAAEVEATGSGDLLTRVGDDVASVTRAADTLVPLVVSSLVTVGVTVVAMAGLDWRLALAGLACAPLYAYGVRWYLPRVGPVYRAERLAIGARAQAFVGALEGAATVRAYAAERRQLAVVTERSARSRDLANESFRLLIRFAGWMNRAESIGLSALLAAGFWLVQSDTVTVGEATTAALLFFRLFGPIGALMMTFDEVQAAGASLTRLVGVAEMPEPAPPPAPPVPGDASVRLRGVTHRYAPDAPPAVDGVDLDLAPGETVALVGPSGAGKTTLAAVLAGQVDRTGGEVLVGGVRVDDLGDRGWREQVALVSQDVHVFAGPLLDDVRLAAPDATDADVASALDLVGARGWVDALPDGVRTVVGEGGHPLTAPQAQQLALARVALADRPVVVLDEATAEAGSAGAHGLEAAAAAVVAGRTAIVVAHRLTQARAADRVIVMEHGRIVEQGTHDDLVARGGRYARLWAAWST